MEFTIACTAPSLRFAYCTVLRIIAVRVEFDFLNIWSVRYRLFKLNDGNIIFTFGCIWVNSKNSFKHMNVYSTTIIADIKEMPRSLFSNTYTLINRLSIHLSKYHLKYKNICWRLSFYISKHRRLFCIIHENVYFISQIIIWKRMKWNNHTLTAPNIFIKINLFVSSWNLHDSPHYHLNNTRCIHSAQTYLRV